MPRTAHRVSEAPTSRRVLFRLVDSRGKKGSVSLTIPIDTDPASIDAVADAMGAATYANLYEINVTDVFVGDDRASLAQKGSRYDRIEDRLSITFKDVVLNKLEYGTILAPNDDVRSGGSEVDNKNELYEAFRDAVDKLLGGGFAPTKATLARERRQGPKTNL